MESLLLLIAGWLGRSMGFLTWAMLAAGVALAAVVMIGRSRGSRPRGLVPATLFVVFAAGVARNAAGYAFILSGNPEDARSLLLILAPIALGFLVLILALRNRPRLSAASSCIGILFFGFSHPIAEARARVEPVVQASPMESSIPRPSPRAAPATYPKVQVWVSSQDGIAAAFPEQPTRVGAASQDATGFAYQAAFQFEDGGALASVFIVPTASRFTGASARAFLNGAHEGFLQALGASPADASTEWDRFADGRTILRYTVRFQYQGSALSGRGFWLLDGQRALRISVAYPLSLSAASIAAAEHFPSTFMLLGR